LQAAVDGGGTHCQELLAHQWLQTQRTLGLQPWDQFSEEGRQALATEPAACLSAQTQRADDRVGRRPGIVGAPGGPGRRGCPGPHGSVREQTGAKPATDHDPAGVKAGRVTAKSSQVT
jgi:hypothetical protein